MKRYIHKTRIFFISFLWFFKGVKQAVKYANKYVESKRLTETREQIYKDYLQKQKKNFHQLVLAEEKGKLDILDELLGDTIRPK